MDKFNTITDPETGNNIDINDPKAMSILQKYSDISGRTRQINKEFFKFREFEFNQVNNVVYPFLIKIIAKEKVPDYINSHLNCEINQNHTIDEIFINQYKSCFNKFIEHINSLKNKYTSLIKVHNKKNISFNVDTGLFNIKR